MLLCPADQHLGDVGQQGPDALPTCVASQPTGVERKGTALPRPPKISDSQLTAALPHPAGVQHHSCAKRSGAYVFRSSPPPASPRRRVSRSSHSAPRRRGTRWARRITPRSGRLGYIHVGDSLPRERSERVTGRSPFHGSAAEGLLTRISWEGPGSLSSRPESDDVLHAPPGGGRERSALLQI
jgi:hypothetical protein